MADVIRLIQFLIFGHVHKWVTTREAPLEYTFNGKTVASGRRYTCRCELCGEIIKRDIIG